MVYTMVYLNGIYHALYAIYPSIYHTTYHCIYHLYIPYIHIYHGIYHNISSLFISHSILVTSTPPGAALFSSPLQRLNCSLASFGQSLLTPLLSFCHSDLARLPPPIAPHPEVELIEPASVASPHAGIRSSSGLVAEAVGQGGM